MGPRRFVFDDGISRWDDAVSIWDYEAMPIMGSTFAITTPDVTTAYAVKTNFAGAFARNSADASTNIPRRT